MNQLCKFDYLEKNNLIKVCESDLFCAVKTTNAKLHLWGGKHQLAMIYAYFVKIRPTEEIKREKTSAFNCLWWKNHQLFNCKIEFNLKSAPKMTIGSGRELLLPNFVWSWFTRLRTWKSNPGTNYCGERVWNLFWDQ